jgi:hypothetical protein
VKSGTPKGGPDRDRGYWEPPRAAIGRIEAHIEEIGGDESELGPPPTRRGRVRRTLQGHLPALVAGLGVIAVLVAVVVTGPSKRPQPTPSSTPTQLPSEIALATDEPTTPPSPSDPPTSIPTIEPLPTPTWTPNYAPPPTDPPEPTPSPAPAAKGWPVVLDPNSGRMVVGPDGTVYVSGGPGLTKAGHTRNGWLQLPDGSYEAPAAFGSDGTIYVVSQGADGSQSPMLFAFAANGKLRAGWPFDVPGVYDVEPGPSGTVYVFSDVNAIIGVTVFSPAGNGAASWTIGSDLATDCGHVIRPDGTLFYAHDLAGGPHCSVEVFSATGGRLSNNTVPIWDVLTMAPDGTVVALGYDAQPYNRSIVAQTRLAVLGTDGLPAAGWPVAFEGAVSRPTFGPDGSIYVAQAGVGTSASRVISLDAAGAVKAGWPVSLPVGFGPFSNGSNPSSPEIGDDGTIYVAAINIDSTCTVTAFDPSGHILPGWPYTLPQTLADFSAGQAPESRVPGPMFVRSPSGRGLLYVALTGQMVALGHDGKVAAGWPYLLDASKNEQWTDWGAMPDGGVVAMFQMDGTNVVEIVAIHLTPAGKLAR